MKISKKIFLLLVCLILLLSFSSVKPASAQETGPWVYISPETAEIHVNESNQVTVDVMLRDVKNIGGFDVRVEFDSSIVKLESYVFGSFLKNVGCSNEWIGPNYIQLVCAQFAQPTGQTGTGSILRLTFSGVAKGVTAIDITRAELANFYGYLYLPGMTDGTLYVIDPSNFIYLPLIMNLSVQGALDRGGIDVALGRGVNNGMGPYSGTSLDEIGNNLTIPGVVADRYRISTNHPRVLNITPEMNKFYTLASEADPVPALRLVAGNAVWTDNEIKLNDLTVVCGALEGVELNEDADVNFDGVVDARDLALVAGNFGLNSGDAYAAWLP